ncbi:leukocyte elastase inhibitor-like isoform X1 [Amphibalanus amphitrite]|uniref:leukocyte elastase inhibitor-like isoform X1 n=1 Tax=Amphibalanus amphitrite TaxID=1232801 RepID=UPI001C918263|nr:leukocyte elastase inhibitor-like isoform X1 [Amphibalanus amphitrite]
MQWTAAVVLVLAAGLTLRPPGPVSAKKPRHLAAEAQSQFGLDMYKTMTEHDKSGNLFFSPLSIGTALAMTYAGSGGNTTTQMESVMNFGQRRSSVMRAHRALLRRIKRRYSSVALRMTNRLYVARRMRLRGRFSRFMDRIFGAEIKQLAFNRPQEAASAINSRVSEDTNGTISTLIEPYMINGATRLVLVNAVYFKGDWLSKFDRASTVPGTFHAPDGDRAVQMMQTKQPFPVGRLPELKARVLLLPYKGNKIHMMIILPFRKDGMATLERGLAKTSLQEVFQAAKKPDRAFNIKMPRFKLDERIDLKRVLHTMGLKDLFDPGKADLSRISRGGNLHVTDAIHKAVIEVNEEGTVASAVTAIKIGYRRLGPKPPPFVVDRPFFFALFDAGTGLTLFVGRVMDPTL